MLDKLVTKVNSIVSSTASLYTVVAEGYSSDSWSVVEMLCC